MKMIGWDDEFGGSGWYGVAVGEQRQTGGRSQELNLPGTAGGPNWI